MKNYYVIVKSEYQISYAEVEAENIQEAERKFLDSFEEPTEEGLYEFLIKTYDNIAIIEANFVKKATGVTKFTCEDGQLVKQLVRDAYASGKATTAIMRSTGINNEGETVAEFAITWTFKVKSNG